jgi:hypothetical protein
MAGFLYPLGIIIGAVFLVLFGTVLDCPEKKSV